MSAEPRQDKVSRDDEPVEELSYMAASRELDGIVEFFEKSEVDVDQLVTRLERATAIVDELDRRIRRTRTQVEELVPKLEAAGRTAASPDPTDDNARARQGDDQDASRLAPLEDEATDGETLPF
jgi:exonuclease VII small subunit